jgi:type VI protein secretion system component VasK
VPNQGTLWFLGALLVVWLTTVAAITVWILACWWQGRRSRAARLTGRHGRDWDPDTAVTVQQVRHRLTAERQRERELRARLLRRVTVLARTLPAPATPPAAPTDADCSADGGSGSDDGGGADGR